MVYEIAAYTIRKKRWKLGANLTDVFFKALSWRVVSYRFYVNLVLAFGLIVVPLGEMERCWKIKKT